MGIEDFSEANDDLTGRILQKGQQGGFDVSKRMGHRDRNLVPFSFTRRDV